MEDCKGLSRLDENTTSKLATRQLLAVRNSLYRDFCDSWDRGYSPCEGCDGFAKCRSIHDENVSLVKSLLANRPHVMSKKESKAYRKELKKRGDQSMELELIKFIKEHNNWEELLLAAPYNLKISRDDGYIMLKYNQLSSDFSNRIVRECRGIVLRERDFKPVCIPFFKFGNYGESYCPEIDWESASVQQKVDGSLIKLWYDDGIWQISTNGTIDAFKADLSSLKHATFGDLVLSALPMPLYELREYLDHRCTYMFELVSPENRVVIPYQHTKLYLLGARDNESLLEYMPEQTTLCKEGLFDIPKRYKLHSLADVQHAASELPWDEEGYVVCDRYFNRVKIKSPEYVKAHFARNNSVITYERLMEVILAGEEAEFLIYTSDFRDDLMKLKAGYFKVKEDINAAIRELNPESFADRKAYAAAVESYPSWMHCFLFRYNSLEAFMDKVCPSKWVSFIQRSGYLE